MGVAVVNPRGRPFPETVAVVVRVARASYNNRCCVLCEDNGPTRTVATYEAGRI